MVYFLLQLLKDNNRKEIVDEKIIKANQTYVRNRTLLKSNNIAKKVRINIYESSQLIYFETIAMNRKKEEDLKGIKRK